MKKNYCKLFVSIFLVVTLNSFLSDGQITRLSTGFDNYIGSAATVPASWYISWNSTSSPSYYITSGNYGAAIPSYKFGNNGDEIISPHFLSGDTLRFWYKGQGLFSAQNSLLILYSEDSTNWNSLVTLDTMLVTGTTFSYPLPCQAHYLLFLYNQVSGNLAFDDVLVTMTDYSPVAAASTTLNSHCAGDTVCFFDVSTIAGCDSIVSHTWNFGDSTAMDSSMNPCHVFSQAGNYTVKLFVSASNGNIDSTTVGINIYPLPATQFSANNTTGTLVDFTDLSSVSNGNITNWFWNFGDSTMSIQQNPLHYFPTVGTFYACLTATSSYGCSSTLCDSVYVIGAGIEDNNPESTAILITPNPAKGKFYVICNTLHGDESLELFNAVGKMILKSEIRDAKSEIDVNALPAGVYFLKVFTNQKTVIRRVVITD